MIQKTKETSIAAMITQLTDRQRISGKGKPFERSE
jgi:hypothetical protein